MEKIIKSLIKDELINTKLILGLNELGLDAGLYQLHLSQTILNLIGIKIGDSEFEKFDLYFDEVNKINIEDTKKLNKLTDKIYTYLIEFIPNKFIIDFV
jgi:hypothetical protein